MVGVEVLQVSSTGQQVTAHFRSPAHVPRPPLVPTGKQIVVGVDGSAQSLRALEFAVERAGITSEAVVAVLAFQHRAFAAGGALGVRAEDVKAGAQAQAQLRVETLVETCAIEHPDIEIRATAVQGRPAWVLKRLSEDASLLVVGSRGRTLMKETILGSVSQKVLHRAACPVIVVR